MRAISRLILVPVLMVPGLGRADAVKTDSVIVQGSLAVGFDAVNNEAFGDDVIRLKENNLRILFQDTSGDPGKPTNDWLIRANDSVSGGNSRLGIHDAGGDAGGGDTQGVSTPFLVEAGVADSFLRVAPGGAIGMATASPSATLHVNVTFDAMVPEQGTVIGPEALVPAGALLEVQGPVYLSAPGAADLTVDPVGEARLYVEGGAIFSGNLEIASSRGFKEDFREISPEEASRVLRDLAPVHYRYRGDGEEQAGFIAEDVPDLVATDSRRSLMPMDVIAVLSAVVREREHRIRHREQEIRDLRAGIEELKRLKEIWERSPLPGAEESEAPEEFETPKTIDLP